MNYHHDLSPCSNLYPVHVYRKDIPFQRFSYRCRLQYPRWLILPVLWAVSKSKPVSIHAPACCMYTSGGMWQRMQGSTTRLPPCMVAAWRSRSVSLHCPTITKRRSMAAYARWRGRCRAGNSRYTTTSKSIPTSSKSRTSFVWALVTPTYGTI